MNTGVAGHHQELRQMPPGNGDSILPVGTGITGAATHHPAGKAEDIRRWGG